MVLAQPLNYHRFGLLNNLNTSRREHDYKKCYQPQDNKKRHLLVLPCVTTGFTSNAVPSTLMTVIFCPSSMTVSSVEIPLQSSPPTITLPVFVCGLIFSDTRPFLPTKASTLVLTPGEEGAREV